MILAYYKKLLRNERGAILPIFGVLVLMMVVIGGAAIDVSRAVNAREKLSYAIDAAALSVATDLSTSVMTDDEITQAIEDSFRANLANAEFLDKAIENLSFVLDSDEGTINISSSANLSNYFLDIGGFGLSSFGPDTFTFGTNAQVSYSRFDVELALVVDVTGSMAWSIGSTSTARITALRAAGEELVNILLPTGGTPSGSKVRISLVPYSQGVNLASYANKVKGGDHYSVSGNCVTERQDYASNTVMLTDTAYNYDTANPPALESFYGGASTNCSSSSQFIPLSSNRTTLINAIRALNTNGGTAGQTGIVWGWNSISPNYANLWPSDSAPEAYTNDDVLKFAIIMTDGDNNRYYEYVDTERRRVRVCNRYYCWREWQDVAVNDWRERGESESYSNTSSTRSRDLCAAMKTAGIEIFGVYFGTDNSSAGARNMSACASTGNYYQATSSEGLIQAFSNIAKKIQQIYLSQ
ncbi:TadE/TadG family type IV pilus assembly protein [Labrenzia sp. PHM005]|uniref:TadE/TadG family type IV pilus assembly protein n=1 Tax=Labrenzia sp. PHM005 TaxID=2590016 RepID=UPI00114073CD|nr:TadE/TadG family type IV pilus assembly protein [Labrenzia sp. PHM005]QDG75258.1 pilus assembly protein [Labrenzia sp. PHM005]